MREFIAQVDLTDSTYAVVFRTEETGEVFFVIFKNGRRRPLFQATINGEAAEKFASALIGRKVTTREPIFRTDPTESSNPLPRMGQWIKEKTD